MANDAPSAYPVEKELREKLIQLAAILNNSPDIAWLKDRESRFIAVNEPFGRVCGCPPEEVVGKTDLDIWPQELAERFRADDQQAMELRQQKHIEERLIASDGSEMWVETIRTPILDDAGTIIGTTGIARDITGRRRTEEVLRDRKEQYRLLFEQAIDGICLADAETGMIIDCNRALLKMLGREKAEVVGQAQKILHPPEEQAGDFSVSFRDHRSLAAGQVLQSEIVRKTGERRTVEIKANAFELKGRKVLQGIFRDVTERRQADRELQASHDLLHAIAQAQADFISEGDPKDLFERLLRTLLDLTGSECGFIGEILHTGDNLPYLKTHAITNISWNDDTRRFYEENAPLGMEFYNLRTLFGEVIKKGQPVISNSPSSDPMRGGLPEGHPPLLAFLGLPLYRSSGLTGMVGIANRPGGYDEGIIRYLQPLLATCANIIEGYRNENRRRLSEDALRESQMLLMESQSIAHLGSWKRDLVTDELSWTGETYRIFGWPPDKPLDYNEFMRVVHPDDKERLRPAQVKAFDGRADLDIEYRIIRPDGEVRWLHERSRGNRDGNDRLIALEGIVHDITARKSVEEELRQSRERYRELVEGANSVIIRWDRQGRLLYINPFGLRLFGYSEEELIGRNVLGTIVPEYAMDGKDLDAMIRAITANPNGFLQNENENICKDGRRVWINWTNKTVVNERGEYCEILSVGNDVTDRKRAEEEKIEIERQLLHAQKLESLGVLAGGIAHDFNNLLMAILGNLDLALLKMAPNSSAREVIERAVAASQRAADLARQMLAYSGKGRFLIMPVDVSGLVEENIHLFRAILPKTTSLTFHAESELPLIEADAAQVQQVIMNLITNAVESLRDGHGEITISAGSGEYDEAALEPSQLKEKPSPGRFVYIAVTDTGCGMDEETQQRLFDPFFTTKFTGRGLGMSAVLGIIRAHGGAIFLKSKPGKGASVKVLFPVAGREIAAAAVSPVDGADRKHPLPETKRETILVVDDEKRVRTVCVEMLTQLGFRVMTAADGQEALEIFRTHADDIDCVIVDLSMPKMDGLQVLESMLQFRENVPAILSSGYGEQETIPRCRGRGPGAFLQKPYSLKQLQAALGKARRPIP